MMRALIRPCLAFGLVLLLALTSQSMALARMAPDPSGQVVLCTGNGPVMVYTDDDGQPVGPPHVCPDCAFGAFLAVEPPVMAGAWDRTERRLATVPVRTIDALRPVAVRRARAPPVPV